MKPILFNKTETTYTSNGLGRLDAISCKVIEERNGMFELEMEIAEAANHATEIEICSIIVAKPSQSGSNQAFLVYKLTKPINGKFKVYAQHISYQLSYIPVMPFTVLASASACAQTLASLKANAVHTCPFNFSTDISVVNSYIQNVPASLRSRLGGVNGSVLDQFGGEYKFDNFNVYLLANRGVITPTVSLRYGKNITDLNQEENIQNTITGIVPYWQNSEGNVIVTLPEKVVESANAANFPFKRTVPYDFSQAFQEEPTVAQLRAKAQAYVNQSGIGVPKVYIKLSFVSLADTEEYKDIAAIQAVNLCDNIGVYFEKLGISTTAKIVKTVYDVLKEKYESVEIGSLRSTLSSTISSQNGAITTLANNTQKMFKQYNNTVGEMIDTATAWLTKGDGFVVAVKNTDGSWKELLFMDTPDVETAHNVLRVNQNGIGFSSTGVAGPYTQAWTLDGRMVIGGTNVPSLTVYDNSQNILFRIDKNGLQWNAPNSSMTTAGVLSMKGGTINAGTVKGGIVQTNDTGARIVMNGTDADNPSLTVYDNQDNIMFHINKDGILWNAPNSRMSTDGTLSMNGGSINAGTITGATIQTDDENSRIVLDSSSSVKGYYNDTLHNIINMSNRNDNNNDLIIDADHQLHIRTPRVYVTNDSYGTGGGTVYETYNNADNGFTFVSDVYKRQSGEHFLADVPEDEADVLCMLPVLVSGTKTTFKIRHGMLLTGATTESYNIT
ncbi:MAG: phage tail protein [Butyrivibrio sp.]|nr:phage tail protein [Butyrivibrio sp.]